MQNRGTPPAGLVRQAPDHRVTRLALAPAASTPPILTSNTARQHCMVCLNALTRHLQPQAIQARERAQIRAIKGSIGHVEVFQMDGVAISIIGRPRLIPGHDTPNPANNTYTLNYEEPLIPLITIRARYTEQRKRSILSNNPTYLNFIIEEAHTLLSHGKHIEDNYHQNALLDSLEQIIIEGRHLGIFLTLSSQRPSEISTRITSQLHHYLIHRLVNPTDLACIQSAISFLDSKSFESIPSLPCGTCIISGTSIQIPAVVKIDELPEGRRPDNETINLVKLWGLDSGPAVEDDSDSSVSTSTRAKSAADADSTRASDT